MQKSSSRIFLSVALVALFASCASEPTEELDAAEAAMAAAKQAEADVFVSDTYTEASGKLNDARREIADGNYDRARELLAEAEEGFEEAASGVEAAKQQALQDAQEAQSRAGNLLTEAEEALKSAPRGKGSLADLQALQSDLEDARELFTAAEADLAAGDSVGALEGFQNAAAKAQSVIDSVPA